MAPFKLTQEASSGIIHFRAVQGLSGRDASRLTMELQDAIVQARTNCGRVRLLWDNREGIMFSTGELQSVVTQVRQAMRPEDRTAILVSTSLNKVRARQQTDKAQEIFISESAARHWLGAWQ